MYIKIVLIVIIILFVLFFIKSDYKVKVNEHMYNNHTTYIPYWEIKKIRDYEECAWRNVLPNKITKNVSINNYLIKNVINKVLKHYQKDDFMKQYQYRVFIPDINKQFIPMTIHKNEITQQNIYSIKLNIYRLYVYSDKNIYNQTIQLDTNKLKNTQGFEVEVFFETNNHSIHILKVDYLRSIQNQNYFYNLD